MNEKKGIKKTVTGGKIKESFELEKGDKGLVVTAHKVFPDKEDEEDEEDVGYKQNTAKRE